MKQAEKVYERKNKKTGAASSENSLNNAGNQSNERSIIPDSSQNQNSMEEIHQNQASFIVKEDQLESLIMSYFERFDQKIENIDSKLSQTRNVVCGIARDMLMLRNHRQVAFEHLSEEIEVQNDEMDEEDVVSTSSRGRGGRRRGRGTTKAKQSQRNLSRNRSEKRD